MCSELQVVLSVVGAFAVLMTIAYVFIGIFSRLLKKAVFEWLGLFERDPYAYEGFGEDLYYRAAKERELKLLEARIFALENKGL